MRPMRLALLIAGSLSVLYIAHPSPHSNRTITLQSIAPLSITPETNQAMTTLAIAKTQPPAAPPTVVTPPVVRATPNRASRSAPRRTPPQPAPNRVAAPNPGTATNVGGVWACIRLHESGGNYSRNSGNGYYGAYQFSASTWNATMKRLGYGSQYPRADLAPPAIQDQAAVNLQAVAGWGQWPRTSRMCGVR